MDLSTAARGQACLTGDDDLNANASKNETKIK